ncbi:MAG TPA: alkaline phosphatase family protein [Polyangia bacterium]|nr:alkaline phosphatase family protein [Polyangia bacterium]
MPRRTWLLAHAVLRVLAGAVAIVLAATYPRRLSTPTGFCLVTGHDDGPKGAFERPEHVVVTLADGLGADDARFTWAVRWFRAQGRCFVTQVGSPSISRPLYTVISSGVEQDRTGIRGNDETRPAAVGSVWQNARESGWHVRLVSELPWWQELFPRGFDETVYPPGATDFFGEVRPGALNLVHVLYIDHAGHHEGAGSREYVAAVRRLDRELAGLIARTDLATSLLVLTADHGHSLIGGHGGSARRVANVMTCFAGKNVQPDNALGALRAPAIGPAIALLTGVPFPPQMRAVDDDLDTVLSIARADASTRDYLADRRQTVEKFRAQNRAWLAQATGSVGSWDELYHQRRVSQRWRGVVALALLAAILALTSKRLYLLWGLATVATTVGAFWVLRGSLDLTAMNARSDFIALTTLICLALGSLSSVLFAWMRGNADDALRVQTPGVVALLGVTLAHIVVYGLDVGFPLPPPTLLFFPYFSTVALVAQSALGLATGVVIVVGERRARGRAARTSSP